MLRSVPNGTILLGGSDPSEREYAAGTGSDGGVCGAARPGGHSVGGVQRVPVRARWRAAKERTVSRADAHCSGWWQPEVLDGVFVGRRTRAPQSPVRGTWRGHRRIGAREEPARADVPEGDERWTVLAPRPRRVRGPGGPRTADGCRCPAYGDSESCTTTPRSCGSAAPVSPSARKRAARRSRVRSPVQATAVTGGAH